MPRLWRLGHGTPYATAQRMSGRLPAEQEAPTGNAQTDSDLDEEDETCDAT